MMIEEISRCAASGKIDMSGMPYLDRWLFYALREIYTQYSQKVISKAEGERKKNEIMCIYRKEKADLQRAKEYEDRNIRMWREIEEAGSVYRKDPTIEHADAFLKAVYGVGRIGG